MPDPNSPSQEAKTAVPSALAAAGRWRHVFPGQERELAPLRRWLKSLLPACEARDDVIAVATELASNAVRHTRSGQGNWFAVELTWHTQVMRVAVADCGGTSEPHLITDPLAEHGRGLLVVRGLSQRTGMTGDHHGRLVWADLAWPRQTSAIPRLSHSPGHTPGTKSPHPARCSDTQADDRPGGGVKAGVRDRWAVAVGQAGE